MPHGRGCAALTDRLILLSQGYKYMFVSNSDNLGATMDLKLLTWFAQSGKPFAMECATRTDADKKGGHLAQSSKGLLLRESAQCPESDEKEFQNVSKHKYFNTNNLWVNLTALKARSPGPAPFALRRPSRRHTRHIPAHPLIPSRAAYKL